MAGNTRRVDLELARLDPQARIAELEHENRVLRAQLDREIRGRLYAESVLTRGGAFDERHP